MEMLHLSMGYIWDMYIPAKRDIRLGVSCRKGQCLNEVKNVPRGKLKALLKALAFP